MCTADVPVLCPAFTASSLISLLASAELATGNQRAYLPFGLARDLRAAAEDFAQDDILSPPQILREN